MEDDKAVSIIIDYKIVFFVFLVFLMNDGSSFRPFVYLYGLNGPVIASESAVSPLRG